MDIGVLAPDGGKGSGLSRYWKVVSKGGGKRFEGENSDTLRILDVKNVPPAAANASAAGCILQLRRFTRFPLSDKPDARLDDNTVGVISASVKKYEGEKARSITLTNRTSHLFQESGNQRKSKTVLDGQKKKGHHDEEVVPLSEGRLNSGNERRVLSSLDVSTVGFRPFTVF